MASATVGLLRDTLLPNLQFHTSLIAPAWLVGSVFGRFEAKDVLWSSGQLLNVWWSAVGHRLFIKRDKFDDIMASISRPGWLILAGMTLWGTRLTYRVISRSSKRGHDDPRYRSIKQEGVLGWLKGFVKQYLPEAAIQSLITLAVTLPFRSFGADTVLGNSFTGASIANARTVEAVAIGLWSAGFALEWLADSQINIIKEMNDNRLVTDGVWGIVRHPNYLGDQLQQFAYPILLFAHSLFHPIALVSPIANYIFLRYLGGDKENEASQLERYKVEDETKYEQFQLYRRDKNAFWPGVKEVTNGWVWAVVAWGFVGVGVERVARRLLANVHFGNY